MNTLELLYNKALMKAAADQDEQVKKGKVWFTILKISLHCWSYFIVQRWEGENWTGEGRKIGEIAVGATIIFKMFISLMILHYIWYFNIWVTENISLKDSNSILNYLIKKASPSKTANLSSNMTNLAAGKISMATTTTKMANLLINLEIPL